MKIFDNKLVTPRNIVIGSGLIIVGYFLYSKFIKKQDLTDHLEKKGMLDNSSGPATRIILNISPSDIVISNSFMTIDGAFLDNNNKVMTVPEGYYYIFRDTGLSTGYQFVYGGTLGKNVSSYHINIPTTFFQDGSYEIVVSDEPIPDQTLGVGAFANPPYQGDTTFKDSSNVIKNALTGFKPAPVFPSTNRVYREDMPQQVLANDLASLQ